MAFGVCQARIIPEKASAIDARKPGTGTKPAALCPKFDNKRRPPGG